MSYRNITVQHIIVIGVISLHVWVKLIESNHCERVEFRLPWLRRKVLIDSTSSIQRRWRVILSTTDTSAVRSLMSSIVTSPCDSDRLLPVRSNPCLGVLSQKATSNGIRRWCLRVFKTIDADFFITYTPILTHSRIHYIIDVFRTACLTIEFST